MAVLWQRSLLALYVRHRRAGEARRVYLSPLRAIAVVRVLHSQAPMSQREHWSRLTPIWHPQPQTGDESRSTTNVTMPLSVRQPWPFDEILVVRHSTATENTLYLSLSAESNSQSNRQNKRDQKSDHLPSALAYPDDRFIIQLASLQREPLSRRDDRKGTDSSTL